MVGFSSILGTGQVEDQEMTKDKLIDGKKLRVNLEVNQLKMIRGADSKYDL